MIPADCKLERFFAQWEFTAEHVLCSSDIESFALSELLDLADEDSLSRWNRLTLGYTETAGHPALRAAIARQYDVITPEDVVVCGGGAVEALFLVSNALLGSGQHAVVVWPAFESLYKVARAAGADVTLVPLDAAARWRLDLDAITLALRPDTAAIVVNFPHNPTGAILDAVTFRGLADLARERGIAIVSDEVYRYLEFDQARRLPAMADADSKSISIGVMSKAYGLAGLRVGWIATRNAALLRRVVAIKDYTSVCSSAPSEILALMALRAHERVVARSSRIVADNLAHVDAFFGRWRELFDWVRPEGGTVGFPMLNAPMPVDRFVTELVEEHSVLLLPASVFDHPENRFRIGLGRRSLPEAIERLDQFVSDRLA